jgi:NADP-dependent 3-hydroxy acid dehydrogenase YdfG
MHLERDQVAVITGAASGIGLGLAEAFGERGLAVVLADIEEAALDDAAAQLLDNGVNVQSVVTDVTDAAAVDDLRDAAISAYGRVDVVCNNAGVIATPRRPVWEYDLADWHWVMGVNLWGVIHGIRSFVPTFIEQGRGHVLNTSSMAGLMTVADIGPYTATKRAVVGLSESLHAELAARDIAVSVTVLCPGTVESKLGNSARNRPAKGPAATETEVPLVDAPTGGRGLTPRENAELAIAAVEAGRLHVAPGVGTWPAVQAHMQLVQDNLSGEPV